MKLLVEIHALQNFSPSNLNRDDTGAPKDAFFGGQRRARISSQCLKRAVRGHFENCIKRGLFNPDSIAIRTKLIQDHLVDTLVQFGYNSEESAKKIDLMLRYFKLKSKEGEKTKTLVSLTKKSVDHLAKFLMEKWDESAWDFKLPKPTKQDNSNEDQDDKSIKAQHKKLEKALGPILKDFKPLEDAKALDIALFGRMLADMPETNQDAACQVAHAISTHAIAKEFDYFTAIDDLKPRETLGAGMLGYVEFNSACFYRYSLIDFAKFMQNLENDEALALKGVRSFIEGFVLAKPTGKQNSFAAHNPPEFVLVTIRENSFPINLANAFEEPVRVIRDKSLTTSSSEKLIKKYIDLQRAYGSESDRSFLLDINQVQSDGFVCEKSRTLNELLDSTLAYIKQRKENNVDSVA